MDWVFYTLLASVASAVILELNHRFQLKSRRLIFWRSTLACALLLPLLPFVPWPDVPGFYGFAVANGMAAVFADRAIFRTAKRHGGRLAGMYMPIKVIMVFFAWLIIDPATAHALFAHPWLMTGVLVCLAGCTAGAFLIRRNDTGKAAILMVLPASFLLGACDIFATLGMGEGLLASGTAAVVVYVFILNFIAMLFAAWWLRNEKPGRAEIRIPVTLYLFAGGALAVAFVILVGSITLAFAMSPNPGYVAAMMMLSVVWLVIYHRIRRIPDESDAFATMLLLASAVGLLLLTT